VSTAAVALPDGESFVLDDDRWGAIAADLPAHDVQPVRLAYAAAHVILKSEYARTGHHPDRPGGEEIREYIDWEATTAFRRRLARHGFGIAEAMDTAQRFALGWPAARELIERCGRLNLPLGFVAGAGTDHMAQIRGKSDLVDGVVLQCNVIRNAGGIPIILPMPWLSLNRCAPAEYLDVYGAIIRASAGPSLIHWLGPMFLPALEGYFPGDTFEQIMRINPEKVRGAKLSLLDADLEIRLRRSMRERGQIMLTGNDLHFARLIAGDAAPPTCSVMIGKRAAALGNFSHALLGIFDAIAAPAGLALRCLAAGRIDDYHRIMTPCERLGQKLFEAPTQHYKTGLAFLAWLNGHQDNAMLVNHEETCRSREHLLDVIRAANDAGAMTHATTAAQRISSWLEESHAL
jgi:hypothetical protein